MYTWDGNMYSKVSSIPNASQLKSVSLMQPVQDTGMQVLVPRRHDQVLDQ